MLNHKLKIFERKVFRKIYGPINDYGEWQIRCNHGIYVLFDAPDIIKVIKGRRLKWLGHQLLLRNHIHAEK
jgi:hypothetical protein